MNRKYNSLLLKVVFSGAAIILCTSILLGNNKEGRDLQLKEDVYSSLKVDIEKDVAVRLKNRDDTPIILRCDKTVYLITLKSGEAANPDEGCFEYSLFQYVPQIGDGITYIPEHMKRIKDVNPCQNG